MPSHYPPEQLEFIAKAREKSVSWRELTKAFNERFNETKGKEALRSAHRAAKGYFRKHERTQGISDGLAALQAKPQLDEEDEHERLSQYVTALKRRNASVEKELEKERAKTDLLLDTVQASIAKLPTFKPPPKPRKKGYDDEDMVLLFSDSQIGMKMDAIETSGFGAYNTEIFTDSLQKLHDGVVRIYEGHSLMYRIPRLWLLGLGDYIEGENIYPGQKFKIDSILVDQMFLGAQRIAEFLMGLARYVPEVWVLLGYGNHGRLGRKGDHAERSNADYMLARIVQLMLRDQPNINVLVSESALCLVEIRERLFLLAHGNQVKSYLKLPFYGLDTASRRWMSLVDRPIDYVCIGHHHRHCSFDVGYGEAIINGAFPGATGFSIQTQYDAAPPSQMLFGIHPKKGITYRYKMHLGQLKMSLPEPTQGVYTPVRSSTD